MITAKLLLWSAIAFMAFGALAFLGLVAWMVRLWREERRAKKVFAMDPVRPFKR